MKSLPSQHRSPLTDCDVEERRAYSRFLKDPDDESAVVWQQPGSEQLAAVHDESLQGICLIVGDATTLHVGAAATIVYHAEILDGTVVRVDPLPGKKFLVAFRCVPLGAGGGLFDPPAEPSRRSEPAVCARSTPTLHPHGER